MRSYKPKTPSKFKEVWSKRGEYGAIRIARSAKRKEKRYSKVGKCKCGNNYKVGLHSCPFKEDMYGDYNTLCTCCNECRHNCAMDI